MTQDWDDILSEPIAQLHPDLAAAEGGWRGVSPLGSFSPRPQQPPATLPDPELMLSIRRPAQPEENASASEPPPHSLTDQLSLTWAKRRSKRRPETPETAESMWPDWTPPSTDQSEAASSPPAWRQPLRLLNRLLRRGGQPELRLPEKAPQSKPASVAPDFAPARQRQARTAAILEQHPDEPKPSVHETPELTHVRVSQGTVGELPGPTPVTSLGEAPSAEASTEPTEAPTHVAQPEGVLRRWLKRTSMQPTEPDDENSAEPRHAPLFQAVPLIDREGESQDRQPEPIAPEPVQGNGSFKDAYEASEPATDMGEPLSPVVQQRMETLLDVPLREVRVFRNVVSQRLTATQDADAMTIGNQIHMAPGKGEPSTPSGQALLAHELSHVAERSFGREPTRAEEARAFRLEQAVGSASEPVRTLQSYPAQPLAHRIAPARPVAPVAEGAPAMYSGSFGPIAGSAAATSSIGNASAVALAPLSRIPGMAETMAPLSDWIPEAADADSAQDEGRKKQQDEANLVDRVVDAVMRRVRRESALDRERRGAFRSQIGG
jgi:Domain of unknown function (DUF4157)